jgi:hypothetical protein
MVDGSFFKLLFCFVIDRFRKKEMDASRKRSGIGKKRWVRLKGSEVEEL